MNMLISVSRYSITNQKGNLEAGCIKVDLKKLSTKIRENKLAMLLMISQSFSENTLPFYFGCLFVK